MTNFKNIHQAFNTLSQGKMILLIDDDDRENEGDLVIAAEYADTAAINFMAQYGRGLICLSMTPQQVRKLQLPMMTPHNQNNSGQANLSTPFTHSIEAKVGVTTGISAADRARTVAAAISENSTHHDISSPGHIFPLRAHPHGVLGRAGHTEASVDLARLAKLTPAAVICEVMNKDGSMAREKALKAFANKHHLPIVHIRELIEYRLFHENWVTLESSTTLPTKEHGNFTLHAFCNQLDNHTHIALQKGNFTSKEPTLTRLHSSCITGDVFQSLRCDCGDQLAQAMQLIQENQHGIILYLNQEGRGIGLVEKIKAYALQEEGMNTVEANQALGFKADLRNYAVAAHILKTLGTTNINLLTNNPNKISALQSYGIIVGSHTPLITQPNPHNIAYLSTKRDQLKHYLPKSLKGEPHENHTGSTHSKPT